MIPRWHVEVWISWRRTAPGETWWKLWHRNTGEITERTVIIDDVVFYAITSVLATALYVAR